MNVEPKQFRIGELARRLQQQTHEAVAIYTPAVEELIQAGSRNTQEIEQTLDGLLGFCGDDAALLLYRRLCRHYSTIDPVATVEYVHAYREMWDCNASTEASS